MRQKALHGRDRSVSSKGPSRHSAEEVKRAETTQNILEHILQPPAGRLERGRRMGDLEVPLIAPFASQRRSPALSMGQ
jgi:hypothetical protein